MVVIRIIAGGRPFQYILHEKAWKWLHINVDAMWWHRIDVDTTSFWHQMPTGPGGLTLHNLIRMYLLLDTVQILCIGTDRSQQTVQTKITASEEAVWSGSTLFAIPSASFGCINAMLRQTFLFLGQLWQLFEVSQILEFLRYSKRWKGKAD